MYDIIIIGGGPAGITAGIYGKRANKKVLVLEANKVGGNILKAHMVDNYPAVPHSTGEKLGELFLKQALDLGVEIKYERAMELIDNNDTKIIQTLDNMYETKTVIIATGNDRKGIALPNEKELVGRGVSYCVHCDGGFFKKKDVAIIGGGDSSIDNTLYLADICNKVYFIYNGKLDVSKLDKPNIEVIANSNVKEIIGDKVLESIIIDKDNREIKVSGLFVDKANVPETSLLLRNIKQTDTGFIISDESVKTNIDGVFVAGDVRTKSLRQVATAVSDGAIAATAAIKYINEKN